MAESGKVPTRQLPVLLSLRSQRQSNITILELMPDNRPGRLTTREAHPNPVSRVFSGPSS